MTIIFVTDRDGTQHEVNAYDGSSLMETLRDEALGVEAICGGQCACATCHSLIETSWSSKLPPISDDEAELLESLDHYDKLRSRLTCQIPVSGELQGLSLTVGPEE